LTNEYNYMIDDAKDYFVNDNTVDSAIIDTVERYLYLIGKYSNLNSAKFIDDSNGVLLQATNQSFIDEISQESDNKYLLISFLTTAAAVLFFLSKKYVKKINH